MPVAATLEEVFWRHVSPEPNSGCWLWDGAVSKRGYGKIGRRSPHSGRVQMLSAHRVSLTVHGVAIGQGMNVCHRCDNPPCVNPAHLFVGTQKENIRDCVVKGRAKRASVSGEANPNAKISAADVSAIRARLASGEKQRVIAADFGLRQTTISAIKHGSLWSSLAQPEAPR